jgi:hypothetical protein
VERWAKEVLSGEWAGPGGEDKAFHKQRNGLWPMTLIGLKSGPSPCMQGCAVTYKPRIIRVEHALMLPRPNGSQRDIHDGTLPPVASEIRILHCGSATPASARVALQVFGACCHIIDPPPTRPQADRLHNPNEPRTAALSLGLETNYRHFTSSLLVPPNHHVGAAVGASARGRRGPDCRRPVTT